MNKLIKNKFFILGTIISLLGLLFLFASTQWNYCIETRLCGSNAVQYYYRPFYYASLSLMTFFSFFLFLPFRYFKHWLIWVFSWGIVASFAVVYDNLHNLEGLFGPFPIFAREIIIMLTVIFWIITILFCAVLWWRGRNRGQ